MPKQYFWRFVISSSTFLRNYSPYFPLSMPSMSFAYPRTYYSSILSNSPSSFTASVGAGMLMVPTTSWQVLGGAKFLPMREVILRTLSLRVTLFMQALSSDSVRGSLASFSKSLPMSQQPRSTYILPRKLSFLKTSTDQVYWGSETSAAAAIASSQTAIAAVNAFILILQ